MTKDASPVNIITYRLGRDMVYVPLGQTYMEALQFVKKVYPRLAGIDDDQICFTLTVTLRGQQFPVRISPMTWTNIREQVIQYEILDVAVADKVLWEGVEGMQVISPPAYTPPGPTRASLARKNSILSLLSRMAQKHP